MARSRGRTIAIGDVHGYHGALVALLDAILPTPCDTIVMLGDYVDRGPQSAQVLDLLIDLDTRCKLIPLLGNHEEMMLLARESLDGFAMWKLFGGIDTLASYPGTEDRDSLDVVPAKHWQFLCERLVCYHETKTDIFTHASVDPKLAMKKQSPDALRWQRIEDLHAGHVSGKRIICGHSNQRNARPLDRGFALCLDTHLYGGGWLTALDVESEQVWQANQHGIVAESWLPDIAVQEP